MAPGGFQQIQRADGIDVEVVERASCRKIVAGLGGGVDNKRLASRFRGSFNILLRSRMSISW